MVIILQQRSEEQRKSKKDRTHAFFPHRALTQQTGRAAWARPSVSMGSKPPRFVIKDLTSSLGVKAGGVVQGSLHPPTEAPGERTRLSLGSLAGARIQLMEQEDRVQRVQVPGIIRALPLTPGGAFSYQLLLLNTLQCPRPLPRPLPQPLRAPVCLDCSAHWWPVTRLTTQRVLHK